MVVFWAKDNVLVDQNVSIIHSAHLGKKCKKRGQDVLFWPGINAFIGDNLPKCKMYNKTRSNMQKNHTPLLIALVPRVKQI